MRLATLAQFGCDEQGRWRAPPVVSGRSGDGKPLAENGHSHASFLPEDADDDGLIDHIVVFANGGFEADVQSKLDRVTRLWESKGRGGENGDAPSGRKERRLALEGFGRPSDFADSAVLGRGKSRQRWTSITPYLMPWHMKKNFGPAEQIRRELVQRRILSASEAALVRIDPAENSVVRGPRWEADSLPSFPLPPEFDSTGHNRVFCRPRPEAWH